MYGFTREDVDIPAIRARLARMTDDELLAYGRATAFMAGRSNRETWRVQLEEARAEWQRRHQENYGVGKSERREADPEG